MKYETAFLSNYELNELLPLLNKWKENLNEEKNTIENMIDDQHSYNDLQVNDGMKAVIIHRLMQNSTSEQSDIYHQQLSEYCGLDTYSLYKLYIWLKDILNR